MQLINFNDASSVFFILTGATCMEKLLRFGRADGLRGRGFADEAPDRKFGVLSHCRDKGTSCECRRIIYACTGTRPCNRQNRRRSSPANWCLGAATFCRSKSRIKCASLELSYWDAAGGNKERENKHVVVTEIFCWRVFLTVVIYDPDIDKY